MEYGVLSGGDVQERISGLVDAGNSATEKSLQSLVDLVIERLKGTQSRPL